MTVYVAQFVVKLIYDIASDLSVSRQFETLSDFVSIPTANNSVANGGRRSREKVYKLFPPNS